MVRKRTAVSESGADAALHILGGEKMNIVLQLSYRSLTLQKLCRCMEVSSEIAVKKSLEELMALGIVTELPKEKSDGASETGTKEAQYALTGIGRETEPIVKALEDFGHLYLKAEALGLDPSRDGEPDWKIPKKDSDGKDFEGTGEEDGERKPPEEENCRHMPSQVKERHGWLEADGCFLFHNSHTGFQDWCFFGIENEDAGTADIRLITAGEYEQRKEALQKGCAPSSDLGGNNIKITCSRSDLLPDQETFYVAIEDAMIEKSL